MSLRTTDPIADLLTRIRNAIMVGKAEIRVPSSRMKKVIADQLKANHYLADVKLEAAKPNDVLLITINQAGDNANITEIKRLSKPGQRRYVKADQIPKVKNGRGLVLVSTSKGVMTGTEAKKESLGGELLLEVY